MPAQDEFGKAVFNIEVTSEAVLRNKMAKVESVIDRSTQKMEADFNRVKDAQTRLAVGVGILGASVGTLGAVAAASGNKFLGLAAQIGGVTVAMGALATTMGLTTTAIWGAVAASAAFVATPIGAALAGIVVVLGAASAAWRVFTSEAKKAESILADLEQRAFDAEKRRSGRDALALKTEAAKAAQIAAAEAKSEEAKTQATRERAIQLKRLILVQKGGAEIEDFIADAQERALAKQLKYLKIAQETAKARETEAKAWKDLLRARGPQTVEQAAGQIQQARELVEATIRGNRVLRETFAEFAKTENLSKKRRDQIARELGIFDPKKTVRRGEAGFVELSAFAQSGAGRGSVATASPVEAERKRKEDERTKHAKTTADVLTRIEPLLVGGGAR